MKNTDLHSITQSTSNKQLDLAPWIRFNVLIHCVICEVRGEFMPELCTSGVVHMG